MILLYFITLGIKPRASGCWTSDPLSYRFVLSASHTHEESDFEMISLQFTFHLCFLQSFQFVKLKLLFGSTEHSLS